MLAMLSSRELIEADWAFQWVKVFVIKPDDLSWIPGTHMALEGENRLL